MKAQLVLPKIFGDNMVLQRNTAIPVWGWAKPNEKIVVQFNKQTKTTKADKTGKWMLRLDAEYAGGPYDLMVKGKEEIQIKNVLVGEVWLCSGQSNMEWTVAQADNAKNEIATANNSLIRHIKIARDINSLPIADVKKGGWQICDPSTVANFSAVGYFFAKQIYAQTKIPIGIINSTWGGTNIETWISREGFESSNEFKEMIASMPKVNLDSFAQIKLKGSQKMVEALQETKLSKGNAEGFKELNLDDARWPEMNVPQLWEAQMLKDIDGVVWLRKTVMLTATEANQLATIELSKIDDEDITYINGFQVGSMNRWDAKRKYSIAANVLREGKNVIAVRVTDGGGGGRIYGEETAVKLTIGEKTLPLHGKWKFQVEALIQTTNENSLPSLCYNAMIHPLIPFAFQGVLWYQGESNAERAYQYRKAMPLLINDWRQKFGGRTFPFYLVQLASFTNPGNSNQGCAWAELREAQTMTLTLPNTGMAVTTDLVINPNDIHPTNKQDVGKRLAAIALNNVYGIPTICKGPVFKSMEMKDNQIILSFENIGTGLMTTDQYGYIKGFEIAGADQIFHFAKAAIKADKIVLSCDAVAQPVAVHFGWMGDASACNLFNKEGFPAVPFRTDEWQTATMKQKYKIAKF